MDFVNSVANLAEKEGHHPVMHVYYSRLIVELWTHAINGLSENDFILASKIDKL
jgi:4a-hydroxytetrahydrobiopterin dehydratase